MSIGFLARPACGMLLGPLGAMSRVEFHPRSRSPRGARIFEDLAQLSPEARDAYFKERDDLMCQAARRRPARKRPRLVIDLDTIHRQALWEAEWVHTRVQPGNETLAKEEEDSKTNAAESTTKEGIAVA